MALRRKFQFGEESDVALVLGVILRSDAYGCRPGSWDVVDVDLPHRFRPHHASALQHRGELFLLSHFRRSSGRVCRLWFQHPECMKNNNSQFSDEGPSVPPLSHPDLH